MPSGDIPDIAMTLVLDTEADAGYIRTAAREAGRHVARSVPIRDQAGRLYGALDLAADGTLLGIELLRASQLLSGVDA